MKRITVIVLVALIFSSCNTNLKKLREKVTGSDSMAVNFFKGDGTMDTVVAVKVIRDANTIDKMISFITEDAAAPENNCGADGSIHFFKNDQVIQDVFFSRKTNCSQFVFNNEGDRVSSSLSTAAGAFLQSIKDK